MSLTDGEIGISSNSKELVGHWGIYKNNFFSVGLDLKKMVHTCYMRVEVKRTIRKTI